MKIAKNGFEIGTVRTNKIDLPILRVDKQMEWTRNRVMTIHYHVFYSGF
jgi:hypothetical protein